MKQELKDLLLEYLGELMYERDNSNDYFKKKFIQADINAIERLLGLN